MPLPIHYYSTPPSYVCLSGCMFIRFQVDARRQVTVIQSNENAPAVLDSVFKQALLHCNGMWRPTKPHIPYLLPVLYNLHGNCRADTSSKNIGPLQALLKTIPNSAQPYKDGYIYNFLNMVNFKKVPGMALQHTSRHMECVVAAVSIANAF